MSHGKYDADLSANLLDKKNWKRIGNYSENNKEVDKELWNKMESMRPEGPKYNHFYFLKFINNRLYTSGGGFESEGISLSHPGIIQVLEDGQWHIYQDDIQKTTGYSYSEINCLAIDPKDANHVFAGGRTGCMVYDCLGQDFCRMGRVSFHDSENERLENSGGFAAYNFDDDKLCTDDGSSGRACGAGGKYRNL